MREASEKGKNGGIKSGQARRQKRLYKELVELIDDLPVTDDEKAILLSAKIPECEHYNDTAKMHALNVQAKKGNTTALALWLKLKGEMPADNLALSTADSEVKGIQISFVDKSQPKKGKERDPIISGDYSVPIDTGDD